MGLVLRDVRHEAFAQAIADGANKTQAAVQAGYSPASASTQGHKLFARKDVTDRVTVLEAERKGLQVEAAAVTRPILLDAKHEVFAQKLAHGVNQTQAAIQAGFSPVSASTQGHKLSARKDVSDRVTELLLQREQIRSEAMKHIELPTRMDVLNDLVAVREEAKIARNLNARMKANELIGKELGMFVQRTDVRVESVVNRLGAAELHQLAALAQQVIDGEVEVVSYDDGDGETEQDQRTADDGEQGEA